ncbi:hypothetical protein H6784_05300 [Candidatus Nomurabacteria bacterium]|nr:hypothetical protein [Candidatus Kaiserbacteria bacterium]MCB9814796.1 hypothetical protein [Candidatus Nomurabacteria bacterium]
MIRKTITKIRQQPKHVRDKFALGLAGTFTALIFAFWLYGVPGRMAEIDSRVNPDEPGLMSQFMDKLGKQVSSIPEAAPDKSKEESDIEAQLEAQAQAYRASSADYQVAATTSTTSFVNNESDSVSTTTTISTATKPDSGVEQREVRIITTRPTSSSSTLPNL